MSDRVQTRETDRGMWRVVAGRDFRVRLRDKGFVISTAITITVLSIFILIRAYGGAGRPSYDLGYVKNGSAAGAAAVLATQAAALAPSAGVEVRVHEVGDAAAGERQLSDGSLDAVLEAGPVLVSKSSAPSQLATLVEAASQRAGVRSALEDAGVPPDRISGVLNPPPIPARTLTPPDPNRQSDAAVAFIGVLLLYGQLFGYGVWVATGVIEEKASRVVEILLSSIRARQLLAGKIAGIGALGLLQLVCISGFAIGLATATGAIDLPIHAVGAAALVLGHGVAAGRRTPGLAGSFVGGALRLGVGLAHEALGRLLGMADPLGEGLEGVGRLGAVLRLSGRVGLRHRGSPAGRRPRIAPRWRASRPARGGA